MTQINSSVAERRDASAGATVKPKLLFALKTADRNRFLGNQAQGREIPGADCIWAEDTDMTRDGWPALLEMHQPEALVTGWSTPPLPIAWLEASPCSLRYLCHLTGSVRGLVPRSFIERGGLVTNWGALAAPTVAEHALLLALAALRNIASWRPFIESSREKRMTKEHIATRSLFGRRVGIHGFGQVVRALLPLLRPFKVRIFAYSEGVAPSIMRAEGVEPCASLSELFGASDVLFECEALTALSEKSVNSTVLARLPTGAVFVNVGRGKVVDEAALVAMSASGRIRLALDVGAHEPLTADSPACQLADAILSPHIGGPTMDHYPQCGEQAWQNIQRFLKGEPLTAVVTPSIYDRST